jgi:acetoin utilization deacetylase AcuC-like enzyme
MQLVTPNGATEDILLDVHTSHYLQELKTSKMKVAEVGFTNGNSVSVLVYV